jgi:thymidylate synthase (FAD)
MAEVKREIELWAITPNAGELIERIASLSYVTQRFNERIAPKMIKFKSGRTVPFEQFKLDEDPVIGQPLPGYKKDDVVVADVIPASYEKVVKFVIAIGHHSLLRNVWMTFVIRNITRKGALHFLRYQFCHTNMRSQKYLDQGSFEYLLPEGKWAEPGARQRISRCMDTIQSQYEELRALGLDTEWSRGVLPNITAQTMTICTNMEQFRHMVDCLCDDDYVGENQEVMMDMLEQAYKAAPIFFYDYEIDWEARTARRRGKKYARNKHVNWTLPTSMKSEYGIEVVEVPGAETDIE